VEAGVQSGQTIEHSGLPAARPRPGAPNSTNQREVFVVMDNTLSFAARNVQIAGMLFGKIKYSIPGLVLGFILIITTSVSVYADTQYVSDKLIITMREGAGGEYKIIKSLKTGTPVEVLEETGAYYKVQTKDGKEGWVLKQYMTADIPKTLIISGLRKEIEKLKDGIEKLNMERDAIKKDLTSEKSLSTSAVKKLEKRMNAKNDQIYSLTRQLKVMANKYNKLVVDSGDVAKIVSERDMLNEENTRLSTEKNELLQEKKRLFKTNVIYWFLAGGGVFFFGWIIGQFSRTRRRRY
jgi:SH3 domain protein